MRGTQTHDQKFGEREVLRVSRSESRSQEKQGSGAVLAGAA